ncbi:MAG: SusC/RagA family TonB-linked outer membrane protein [Bacteroidales bacterium]
MNLFKTQKRRKKSILPISIILFFCFLIQGNYAQNSEIKVVGKVVDESGASLPGVYVQVKGEKVGTVTDLKGSYNLKTNSSKTIIFSYLGYEKKEISASQANNATISLVLDSKNLNETVVIGYGSVRKKDLTGAVSSVNISDMQKAPVKSFDEALAGRVAGVQVVSVDGQPGEMPNIVIRGNSSLTQDNTPLYVIDGVAVENINSNSINPSDIESMDVLKDASATAIYGSRAANGVIQITTKKGIKGKPLISIDFNVGQASNNKTQQLLSAYQFVELNNKLDPARTATYYFQNGRTLDSYKDVKSINWSDVLCQNALYNNMNLTIRGDNGGTNYSLSGSYTDQKGIIINSGFKRYQGRFNISQKIDNKLTISANLNYANTETFGVVARDYFTGSTAGNPSMALFSDVWTYRPVSGSDDIDLMDYGLDPTIDPTVDYRYNPVQTVKNTLNQRLQKSILAVSTINYSILKELKLNINGSFTENGTQTNLFYNSNTRFGDRRTPQGTYGPNGSINNATVDITGIEGTLTYKNKFFKNHNITLLGGTSEQNTQTNANGYAANNISNEALGIYALNQGVLTTAVSSTSQNLLISYFGRLMYDYNSKYYLTMSYRADGSSKFAAGNRWGYFPSAALSWRISSEPFMKAVPVVSDAKLRLSYGLTGNNRVSDFSYISGTQVQNGYYSFGSVLVPGAYRTSIENDNLKWETTSQTNIGLDVLLFKGRVGFVVDYYNKLTNDLLLNVSLPGSSGFPSSMVNIGSVQNSGLEFTVNTTNIKTKDFSWTTNFNIAFNRNKIIDLAFGQEALMVGSYISKKGGQMGMMYGYIYDGLYQLNDFIDNKNGSYVLKPEIPTNGALRTAIQPGNAKYKDLNGDGVVDVKDQTVIGNGNPLHVGGFGNNFSYRGFSLNVFFQWSYGNNIMNANRLYMEQFKYSFNSNQYATAALSNRWTPDNPNASMPIVSVNNGANNVSMPSTRIIEDGSYLRLKTVQLGYNLPGKLAKKLSLTSVGVFVSAQNLFTMTKYSGGNPDVSTVTTAAALSPGYDYSAYPLARIVTIGVKLTL